eukprot:924639-Amphidinium_carterae.1
MSPMGSICFNKDVLTQPMQSLPQVERVNNSIGESLQRQKSCCLNRQSFNIADSSALLKHQS